MDNQIRELIRSGYAHIQIYNKLFRYKSFDYIKEFYPIFIPFIIDLDDNRQKYKATETLNLSYQLEKLELENFNNRWDEGEGSSENIGFANEPGLGDGFGDNYANEFGDGYGVGGSNGEGVYDYYDQKEIRAIFGVK